MVLTRRSRLFEVDGLGYAYTVQGKGPAALLLHGFTGYGANWDEIVDELADNYRVLTVDLLGHGGSSAPVEVEWYAMNTTAKHLKGLIDAQVGEAVHLLGYSMGGRLALYFTLRHPQVVRSLVLESASPGLEGEDARRQRMEADERLAQQIESEGIPAFVNYWEELPLFASQKSLPEAARLRLHQQRLANRPVGLVGSLRGMGTGAQPSLWDRLGELDLPVLLLTGELDEKFTQINRRMQSLAPRARLEVIPGAGHTVHLERKAEFAGLVRGFWRDAQGVRG